MIWALGMGLMVTGLDCQRLFCFSCDSIFSREGANLQTEAAAWVCRFKLSLILSDVDIS